EDCCQIEIFLCFRFDAEGAKKGASIRAEYELLVAENRISKNLMPFAWGSGGHTIFLLVLSGPKRGHILWKHDDDLLLPDHYDSDFFDQKVFTDTLIADSMADFISKLEPNE